MRLMLLGSPGAGKGTQAIKLVQYFSIPQIATGDMLRTAITEKTELGKLAKSIMEAGKLVPDDIMIELVKSRLNQPDCAQGFLFDGFPRTLPQANALKDADITLDHVIEIVVPDEEIIHRITGRLVHPASGRVYHLQLNPPKRDWQDDITGEPLIQREDDKEATVRQRLTVYHEQTKPLIHYYQQWAKEGDSQAPQFHQIRGSGSVEQVFSKILSCIHS